MKNQGSNRTHRSSLTFKLLGLSLVGAAGISSLFASTSSVWTGVGPSDWHKNYEVLWLTESLIIIVAALCAYWAPRATVALLLPVIASRAIGVGQFVAPKSGFVGHGKGHYTLGVLSLLLAASGFIVLLFDVNQSWRLTRRGLVLTAIVFVVAVTWSVGVAMPWGHFVYHALGGGTWNSNGRSTIAHDCCWVSSPQFTLGERLTIWFQIASMPVVVVISGLWARFTSVGLGWLSCGLVMLSVAATGLFGLGSIATHNSTFTEIESVLPGNIIALAAGALVALIGVVVSLWEVASSEKLNAGVTSEALSSATFE